MLVQPLAATTLSSLWSCCVASCHRRDGGPASRHGGDHGANRGLGLEMARQLTARGDRVWACCRSPSEELRALPLLGGIVPGVDVADDNVGAVLQEVLAGVAIDVLVSEFHDRVGDVGSDPLSVGPTGGAGAPVD